MNRKQIIETINVITSFHGIPITLSEKQIRDLLDAKNILNDGWINPKDKLSPPFLVVLACVRDDYDSRMNFFDLVGYDPEKQMFVGENCFNPERILAWQRIEPFKGWE